MTQTFQQPEEWTKDGSSISGVTNMKTGAWTTLFHAQETVNGRTAEVILKTFTVPEAALGDEPKIQAERERFLSSAKLQCSLLKEGATGWVRILRISENPPAFTMPKCGPSLEDMLDNKVHLSAKELYSVLQSILQALIELKNKRNRSHGDLKASNVLTAAPGEWPPYKLADPTPKGENHSANDLYNLGLILYQLIEHKEYDPLKQLTPSRNWSVLGSRRDRWIQFLNLILSPNGCHDPLTDVRKEALRLKPRSALRPVALGCGAVMLLGMGVGAYVGLTYMLNQPVVNRPPVTPLPVPSTVDPQVKADYEKAHKAYQEVRTQWSATTRTPRYDHTGSIALAREARTLVDEVNIGDPGGYKAAIPLYNNAAEKLQLAIDKANAEEAAGKAADNASVAEFQQAQKEYADAAARWNEAAKKFGAGEDHIGSRSLAEAAKIAADAPAGLDQPSADPGARQLAMEHYKAGTAKYNEAIARIKDENQGIAERAQAAALFKKARDEYRASRGRWEAFVASHKNLDLAEATKMVDEADKALPEHFVLTDEASYRTAADQSYAAAQKIEQALALAGQAKALPAGRTQETPVVVKRPETPPEDGHTTGRPGNGNATPEGPPITLTRGTAAEVSAAIAQGDAALKARNYTDAFGHYKRAAEMGSAGAQCNVGLFLETGTGTTRDYAAAAGWYKKAADQNYAPAMFNLASLYQKGKGVDQNYTQALHLYAQAAKLNHADSMVALGGLYENGLGTEQNFAQAMDWYKKAAELNNPAAITNIGVFYEKGRGVPVDYREAATWYRKAAALNYPPAMNDLAVLYDNGKYDNAKDIKPDYAEALKWYTKAAELDYAPAMCNLGALYDNGQGVTLDHEEAFRWFQKAAQRNHGMAMYNLGVLYETGRGTHADKGEALTWYRKAGKSSDPQAQRLALEALNRLGFSP
jgi:TPR repeat protein